MPHLLVICRANICRSPLAEGLLKAELEGEGGKERWTVSSAGTWTEEGLPMDPRVRRTLAERGIELPDKRSREVTEAMLEEADLVLTMTDGQREALTVEFPEQAGKVRLFSELDGEMKDIRDPVGRGEEVYQETLEVIEGYVQGAGEKLGRIFTVKG